MGQKMYQIHERSLFAIDSVLPLFITSLKNSKAIDGVNRKQYN